MPTWDARFETLLCDAALKLWVDLPRDIQERFFGTAVPVEPDMRNRLAIYPHERHPRAAHHPSRRCRHSQNNLVGRGRRTADHFDSRDRK
jgi:hypothetical protein